MQGAANQLHFQTIARHALVEREWRWSCSSCGPAVACPEPDAGMAGNRFEQVRDGVYLAAREDLRQFVDWHPQFRGAVLKRHKSFVHDTDQRCRPAHITCSRAPGTVARLGAKTRGKCHLDDIIQLNALGTAALQRTKRTGRKGELYRDSVVWRIEDCCQGTAACDPHPHGCAARIVYSATIAQVHAGQASIQVFGACMKEGALSLHSSSSKWDPSSLREQFDAGKEARLAAVNSAVEDLRATKTQLVKRQRELQDELPDESDADDDDPWSVTVGELKSAVVDVQALRDDIGEQQRSLRHAQRVDRPTLCEQQRREVLRLWSEGHLAAEIQSLMPAPAPRLECIQWTIDNERRRTRGGLRPYEALHSICTEVLADSNQVLLYMVPDPDIDWDPRQSSASAPLGALQIAMFGTLAMINVLLVAHALGIDTKWRTRADGGCVQAILAFVAQTARKATEGHRPEFLAGYCAQNASVVAVALANMDCYWTLKVQLDALRGLIPCDDPQCSHPVMKVKIDNRGSFVLQRTCRAFRRQRVWWKDFHPRQNFRAKMAGIIDKAAYEARALRKAGIRVVLCAFHVCET